MVNISPVVTEKDFINTFKEQSRAYKYINKHKEIFPIYPSNELAEIVADLLTDDFMDIRNMRSYNKFSYVGFFAKNIFELQHFQNNILKIFGISGKIREWGIREYGESKGIIFTNNFLTRILSCAGIPGGDKILKEYDIPLWICEADIKIREAFLRRCFTCEGSIGYDKYHKLWEIKYSMHKVEYLLANLNLFLEQLKAMLLDFEIKSSNIYQNYRYKREKDSKIIIGRYIKIKDKNSIINFANSIGFNLPYKQKRLNQALLDT